MTTSNEAPADLRARVRDCFAAAFPELGHAELEAAQYGRLSAWDSLASLTLITVVEQEFELTLDDADVEAMTSFDAVVDRVSVLLGRSET